MATIHKFHLGDGTQPVSLQSINKYYIAYTTASGGYYWIGQGTMSTYILKYFTTTADMRSKQIIIDTDVNWSVMLFQANSTAQNTRPTYIAPSSYTSEQIATGYRLTIPANTLTDTYLFIVGYIDTNTYSSYSVPDTAQILGDVTEWRDGTIDECNSNTWSGTAIREYHAASNLEARTYNYSTGAAMKYLQNGYGQYIYYTYQIQGVNGAGSVRYLVIPPGVTTFTTTNAPVAMEPVTTEPTLGTTVYATTSPLTPTSTEGDNRTYTITASTSTQYIILLNGINQSTTSYCSNNANGTGVSEAYWT